MKKVPKMIAKLLLSLILLSFSSFSFAAKTSGWQTIYTSDTMFCSNLYTFTSDSHGNLYQAGYANAGMNDNSFIRKSIDQGYTWNNIFNFSNVDLMAFTIDQQGAFYVAEIQDPNYWVIQKSTDGGQTWNTVDVAPQFSMVTTLAVAPNGDIYAGGPGPDRGHSIIRKSADNGKTWTTVDDFYFGSNKAKGNKTKFNKTKSNQSKAHHSDGSGEINAIVFDASGNVYYIVESMWLDTWYVRMSTDQGATWTTIDNYSLGDSSIGSSAVIDSAGNIYVAGLWTDEGEGASNIGHWIVRKGSKTNPFVTVDDFKYPDNKRITAPDKIVIDKNGNLYVSGEVIDEESSPKTRALIRMSTDAGANWTTWDDFPALSPDDQFFSANHILIDNLGNFYETLAYTDADYNDRWLTRKYFP